MPGSLPPLQSLKALEAAARHLSYSRAAEELALTHGAVSHHIAKLEALLGIRLFVRDGQRMLPTQDAQVLVARVRQGLAVLEAAFADAEHRAFGRGRDAGRALVVVSVLPSFATRWLMPRLADFHALHPDIDVALRPSTGLARLDGRDGVDLAIRYGPGRWSGVRATRLMPGLVFPAASPDCRERLALHAPGDLRRATLLRKPGQPWQPWFFAAGLDWPEPDAGPSYDDAGLVIDAAIRGQGVALARAALVEDDLAGGRLVRIGDVAIEDVYAWFLVERASPARQSPAIAAFRAWLLDRVAAHGREPAVAPGHAGIPQRTDL